MDAMQLYDRYMITSMVAGFEPVVVQRARGCTCIAADGREYLDCFSGIAVTNAGHNHPKVIAAAARQMQELVHCCTYVYYNARAGELCRLLAEITPGRLTKSFLANSGAEALEGAMRLAKQHTRRRELIALTHSFHGRTYATLSITGNWARKKGAGPYMPGVAFAPAPYCYRCPFGRDVPGDGSECPMPCAEGVEQAIRYGTSNDVAAFIAEPVLGEGGIIVPPAGYFQAVKRILDDRGILFICDEVQTGFGRTGRMFAIEHYGVQPDIVCMAKGIASGFPLGAFTTSDEIAGAFTPGDHLSTFGGNPVSCAAALANIEVLREELLPANAADRGEQIMTRIRSFQQRCPLIGEVRGKGLMIGIELVRDPKARTPAADQAKQVRRLARENGVLVGLGGTFGNVVRIQPPLPLTAQQADRACDVVERALADVAG